MGTHGIVFFESYREIIDYKIKENLLNKRYRTSMAKHLKVQNSYLTHIQNGDSKLTLDQAAGLCQFWRFNAFETEYFILLVSLERASHDALKEHYRARIAALRQKFDDSPIVKVEEVPLNFDAALELFSDWRLLALNAGLTLKSRKTVDLLARRFRLTPSFVKIAMEKLTKMGLAHPDNDGGWVKAAPSLRLENRFLRTIFHATLRDKAKENYSNEDLESIHSSVTIVLSRSLYEETMVRIREVIRELEEKSVPSESEEVAVLLVDFFKMTKS